MRFHILLAVLLLPFAAHGQVYKCVDPDGRTTFANVPCKNPEGISESVSVQTNEMGTFATPEQIRETEYLRSNSIRTATKVTVVADPRTEDPATLGGIVNRRLRLQEEAIAEKRRENPSNVTVVTDTSSESQLQRAVRLRKEAASLGLSNAPSQPEATTATPLPPRINHREVPFSASQSPLDRRIKQIQNKLNDPQPEDASTSVCVKKRPARGVVKIGTKKIWPGMRSAEVRRLIGNPDSINSLLVGREQWVYRTAEGRSLLIHITGACVFSIQ